MTDERTSGGLAALDPGGPTAPEPAEPSAPAGDPTSPGDATTAAGDESPRARRSRRDAGLDGVLVVDKPVGPTSHDVVALVRRLAGTRRIGHGGTLDPFASGVLPLYLGVATRLAEFHLGARKAYRATVCFGASSTTDDLEGELTSAPGRPPTRGDVEAALPAFRGPVEQAPPAFSARQVGGRRAYALARRGEVPVLPARTVTIDSILLVGWDDSDPARPLAEIDVTCSAGTYVRAIARDLGAALGSAAYLGTLRRTAAGPFTLAEARPLEALREAAAAGLLPGLLLPVGAGLDDLPAVAIEPDELVVVAHGGWIRAGGRVDPTRGDAASGPGAGGGAHGGPPVRLLAPDGSLAAIGRLVGARIVPDKVLVPRLGVAATSPDPAAAATDGGAIGD